LAAVVATVITLPSGVLLYFDLRARQEESLRADSQASAA
jgi:hypothetical protein